jgi:hypothetical protein
MVLRIPHNGDAAATFPNHIGLGDGICTIIGALGVNIRSDFPD